jgi:hypothetical protein
MAREDHAPPLESLSPAGIVRGHQELPKIEVREGWREMCGHHALENKTNSLTHACHAPMRGRQKRTQ